MHEDFVVDLRAHLDELSATHGELVAQLGRPPAAAPESTETRELDLGALLAGKVESVAIGAGDASKFPEDVEVKQPDLD